MKKHRHLRGTLFDIERQLRTRNSGADEAISEAFVAAPAAVGEVNREDFSREQQIFESKPEPSRADASANHSLSSIKDALNFQHLFQMWYKNSWVSHTTPRSHFKEVDDAFKMVIDKDTKTNFEALTRVIARQDVKNLARDRKKEDILIETEGTIKRLIGEKEKDIIKKASAEAKILIRAGKMIENRLRDYRKKWMGYCISESKVAGKMGENIFFKLYNSLPAFPGATLLKRLMGMDNRTLDNELKEAIKKLKDAKRELPEGLIGKSQLTKQDFITAFAKDAFKKIKILKKKAKETQSVTDTVEEKQEEVEGYLDLDMENEYEAMYYAGIGLDVANATAAEVEAAIDQIPFAKLRYITKIIDSAWKLKNYVNQGAAWGQGKRNPEGIWINNRLNLYQKYKNNILNLDDILKPEITAELTRLHDAMHKSNTTTDKA